MNKLLIILLSTVLLVLLTVTGVLLYLFSDAGNAAIKPYLKEKLEQELGMPVKVAEYRLNAGSSKLDVVINGQLRVRVVSRFSIWSRSFEGLYHVVAHDFEYEETKLRQADIKGHFRGVAEDIYADGNGTALDAPVTYKLRVVNESLRQIEAKMKGLSLAELLELASQPPLAEGEVDLEVDMPRIGEEGAQGFARLTIEKAYFNRALIKKLYNYSVPKESRLRVKADARLDGKRITFTANSKSDLFTLMVRDGVFYPQEKRVQAKYDLDIKEMRVLTRNTLAGSFQAKGEIRTKEELFFINGSSRSLGGELTFDLGSKIFLTMHRLALSKVLHLLKQPSYMGGLLNGKVVLEGRTFKKGSYRLSVERGELNEKVISKHFGYQIPKNSTLRVDAKGEMADKTLHSEISLFSSVADLGLHKINYDIRKKRLDGKYELKIHDIASLVHGRKPKHGRSVLVAGRINYDRSIRLDGKIKGLGEKVAFSYDGTRANLDALGLYLEKVLVLSGLPVYLRGKLDAKVHLKEIKPLQGTFSLHGKKLQTEPGAMKKLVGKALKTKLVLDLKGDLKKNQAYGDAKIKTPMGQLRLNPFHADIKKGTFSSPYLLKIPDLKKLYVVTGTRLYGSLTTSGKISKRKELSMAGSTRSLGGRVDYTLTGDRFSTKIAGVPLPNILHLMGYEQNFLGSASGRAKYHLKSQIGHADLNIASFQIKPSKLTQTLKMVLGKDPARIIFSSTRFHADIKGNIVSYTLHAKGTRSSIEITEGRLNRKTNVHSAKFKFIYEKHTVYGRIKGTLADPKVTVDTSRIIRDRVRKKVKEKLQKKLEKALGGQAGSLLRGLGL